MYQLEKYKGTRTRHTCPNCGGKREFTRYINTETGEYLGESVGMCNRESKCGYHYTPKQYFADNPQNSDFKKKARPARSVRKSRTTQTLAKNPVIKKVDFIPPNYLIESLGNYGDNSFAAFLLGLFPEDVETVAETVSRYKIGTDADGAAILWFIDKSRNIRTGKILKFDTETGKRQILKTYIHKETGETIEMKADWIHSRLKSRNILPKEFNLELCFFGEHLLSVETEKPIAIVEAEKTAVIASICFPRFVWLAAGAMKYISAEKLARYGNRKIVLYPDGSKAAVEYWRKAAAESRQLGLDVHVSELIERTATETEKQNDFDLADYLIKEQRELNNFNWLVDLYNSTLDKVLNDAELKREVETILDEQKAIAEIDGNLSEVEAERLICEADNLRRVVMNLIKIN